MWYLRIFAFLVLAALLVMLLPATFLFLNLDKDADGIKFVAQMASYIFIRITVPFLALYFAWTVFLEERHISKMRPYVMGGGVAGIMVLAGFCLLNPIGTNNYIPLFFAFTIAGSVTAWLHRKLLKR